MDNLNFTYQELLAEIGAKSLIINRQNAYIAELEEALRAKNGMLSEVEPHQLTVAGNGTKGKQD